MFTDEVELATMDELKIVVTDELRLVAVDEIKLLVAPELATDNAVLVVKNMIETLLDIALEEMPKVLLEDDRSTLVEIELNILLIEELETPLDDKLDVMLDDKFKAVVLLVVEKLTEELREAVGVVETVEKALNRLLEKDDAILVANELGELLVLFEAAIETKLKLLGGPIVLGVLTGLEVLERVLEAKGEAKEVLESVTGSPLEVAVLETTEIGEIKTEKDDELDEAVTKPEEAKEAVGVKVLLVITEVEDVDTTEDKLIGPEAVEELLPDVELRDGNPTEEKLLEPPPEEELLVVTELEKDDKLEDMLVILETLLLEAVALGSGEIAP